MQGDFHNPQMTDSIVEGGHEGVVDIIGIFLIPTANVVEVTDNDPRARDFSREVKQLIEKGVFMTVIRGTTDVRNVNCEVRYCAIKRDRERVNFPSGASNTPVGTAPSCDNSSPGADGREEYVRFSKLWRQESFCFEAVDIMQFRFLDNMIVGAAELIAS